MYIVLAERLLIGELLASLIARRYNNEGAANRYAALPRELEATWRGVLEATCIRHRLWCLLQPARSGGYGTRESLTRPGGLANARRTKHPGHRD